MDPTTGLRVAHDVSLATWYGGALMGAVALNSATIEVDDHTQRTRVANAGWFRWAPITAASLGVHVVSATLRRRLLWAPRWAPRAVRPPRRRGLRTTLTAAAVLVTLDTGLSGQRIVRHGDVPVATAVRPVRATPPEVAAAQRRLRVAQWLVPALTGLLWVLEAVQDRGTGRRS